MKLARTRKIILYVVTLVILVLIVMLYPSYVQKPEVGGTGPLAVRLDPALPIPEYHSPAEWWRLNHKDLVDVDLPQEDCFQCHEASACNNCHNYVGVVEVVDTVE